MEAIDKRAVIERLEAHLFEAKPGLEAFEPEVYKQLLPLLEAEVEPLVTQTLDEPLRALGWGLQTCVERLRHHALEFPDRVSVDWASVALTHLRNVFAVAHEYVLGEEPCSEQSDAWPSFTVQRTIVETPVDLYRKFGSAQGIDIRLLASDASDRQKLAEDTRVDELAEKATEAEAEHQEKATEAESKKKAGGKKPQAR